MIRASRIWMACEETNGCMRSQVPKPLWADSQVPCASLLSLCHTSLHLHAFCFPLTSHSQIFRRPSVSFLVVLAWVLQVRILYPPPSLLTVSPGVPSLSCIGQNRVHVWRYSETARSLRIFTFTLFPVGTTNRASPLASWVLPQATPLCHHAPSSDFTLCTMDGGCTHGSLLGMFMTEIVFMWIPTLWLTTEF